MQWASGIACGTVHRQSVLYALAWHHNAETGRCDPSLTTIARHTQMHRDTVIKSLRWLADSGLVEAQKVARTKVKYRLNFDADLPVIGPSDGGETNLPDLSARPTVRPSESESARPTGRSKLGLQTGLAENAQENSTRPTERAELGLHVGHERVEKNLKINPPIVPPSQPGEPMTGELLPASDEPEPFDVFWEAYPRKTGKADARKAFAKCREPVENLVADIRERLAAGHWSTASDRKRFIMHPATYLRGERWTDEIVPGDLPMDAQSVADRTNAQIDRMRSMGHDPDDPFAQAGNIHRLRHRK